MNECMHAILRGTSASTSSGDCVSQDATLSMGDLQRWKRQIRDHTEIIQLLCAGKPEHLSVVSLRPVEASARAITKELSARDVPPLYLVCALLRHSCVMRI
jgi:hypothetical protein